jgi:Icc-related predicted phosphoesterase
VGCPYLLEKLTQLIELKLHVCGHIHEAYGRMENEKGQIFVNASVLNVNYYMANEPIQVEI